MSTVITDTEAMEYIAANLSRYMQQLELSQADLSRITGESQMRISHYVNAKRMPGAGVLARMAEAFSCSVDDLLRRPRQRAGKKIIQPTR